MFPRLQILVALLLTLSVTGKAAIVYTDINPDFALNNIGEIFPATYSLDLNNDTVMDFFFSAAEGGDFNVEENGIGNFVIATSLLPGEPPGESLSATNLALGTLIGPMVPNGSEWTSDFAGLVNCQDTGFGLICIGDLASSVLGNFRA